MPGRGLERTLEGLRQSALETARLFEERARILRGPSRIDHQLSAKRWSALADLTADLQARLRAVGHPSTPSPQPSAAETALDRANDPEHLVADVMAHLQAARSGLHLLRRSVDEPNDAELMSKMQEIRDALRVMSHEAAAGRTGTGPRAAPAARTRDVRAADHVARVGGWDQAWTWWCSCGASGIAKAWATEREALAAADAHRRAVAAATPEPSRSER